MSRVPRRSPSLCRNRRAEPRSRNPVDRLTRGLPHGWRVTIDWVVTIVGAIAIVLAIKAWVVNPYRIPSSSMEPTLHCARPGERLRGALLRPRAREPLHLPLPRPEARARSSSSRRRRRAGQRCGAGGTFVKRLIGLPGDRIELRYERRLGYVYINGKKLEEPYIEPDRRDDAAAARRSTSPGAVLHDG